MAIDRATIEWVRKRARGRCEYCRLPVGASPLSFPIDHIVARQHGGESDAENLALACPTCNACKGPNVASIVKSTGELVRLFHPRRDRWDEHFFWIGPWPHGKTEIGAATIRVLAINREDAVDLRTQLLAEGVALPAS